jgi:hypothetical protein
MLCFDGLMPRDTIGTGSSRGLTLRESVSAVVAASMKAASADVDYAHVTRVSLGNRSG